MGGGVGGEVLSLSVGSTEGGDRETETAGAGLGWAGRSGNYFLYKLCAVVVLCNQPRYMKQQCQEMEHF